jgi:lysophospholipase L1-like esterase
VKLLRKRTFNIWYFILILFITGLVVVWKNNRPNGDEIVMLGDSLTARCAWEEFFPEFTMINEGIDGNTSEMAFNRIDTVTRRDPEYIFFMIGINDLRRGLKVEDTASNAEKIINELTSKTRAQIFIVSVLPTNTSEVNLEEIIRLNILYKEIAGINNINYLDLYYLYLSGGGLNADFTSDGLHLNQEGYTVWINAIREIIE